jgi:hypothetical protein
VKRFISFLHVCAFLLAWPASGDIRSKWFAIEFGGAFATDHGGFQLIQIVVNTSQQPLWITVHQGEGKSGCEVTQKIDPKEKATFTCDLTELEPGNMPVAITVFADEAHTQALDAQRDAMRFSKRNIALMPLINKAQKLPVTYDGIYSADKPGVGSMFRGMVPHANGKLQISVSAIDFADGKRNVTIPASAILDANVFDSGGPAPWIVVTYEQSGEKKQVGFQPLSHPEDGRFILLSLQAAARQAAAQTPAMPGETFGDRSLQRDTLRTIVQAEKEAAPDCASPKVVDTKIVDDSRAKGKWSERWVVDRCGKQVAYGVRYQSDPNGGTNVAVDKP